jgi:hypothetical protein
MVIGVATILVMAVEGQPLGPGADWWRPDGWWIYNPQDHLLKIKVSYNIENRVIGDHIIWFQNNKPPIGLREPRKSVGVYTGDGDDFADFNRNWIPPFFELNKVKIVRKGADPGPYEYEVVM